MANNVLKYKGYIASVEFSAEDMCLHGKISGINDLVTFEALGAEDVEREFHSAVDDYLAFCAEVGKEPQKAYTGTFNVRIDPDVHQSLEYYAIAHQITLNAAVAMACRKFVNSESGR